MNAQEALFGFMGWLTSRETPVTFSASHDAAIAAELVKEFAELNALPDVTQDYPNFIMPPTK